MLCLHMGIEVQRSALPTLFHFDRVRAASQPHVNFIGITLQTRHTERIKGRKTVVLIVIGNSKMIYSGHLC